MIAAEAYGLSIAYLYVNQSSFAGCYAAFSSQAIAREVV